MIGIVLAAGPARRLHPLTFDLPKTLLPVDDDDTVLDVLLSNLRGVGIRKVVVVVGFGATHIQNRVAMLSRRHNLKLRPVYNHRATVWDSAFSMFLGLEKLKQSALICDGDTLHPESVEQTLLAAQGPDLVLAVDDRATVGEHRMKVQLDAAGRVSRIDRTIDPAVAAGAFIGAALVEQTAVEGLREVMDATWRHNSQLPYEDGLQSYIETGADVRVVPIDPASDWIDIDDHDDLARARDSACRH